MRRYAASTAALAVARASAPALGGRGLVGRNPRRLVGVGGELGGCRRGGIGGSGCFRGGLLRRRPVGRSRLHRRLGGVIGVRLRRGGADRSIRRGLGRVRLGLRLRERAIGSSAIRRGLLRRCDRSGSRCRLLGSEPGCLIGGGTRRRSAVSAAALAAASAAAFAATARSVASRDAVSSAAARVSISISRSTWNASSFPSAAAAAA